MRATAIATLRLAAVVLTGCAQPPDSMTVGGDYRALNVQGHSQNVQIQVYGDRTIILPTTMNLSFYDQNTTPIVAEKLNGYYLFPSLVETFYMKADEQYFIVQLDEKTHIYTIGQARIE